VDRFLFVLGIGVLLRYAQFPFWPSEPPRVVVFGQDIPAGGTIFRRFKLWLLGRGGIRSVASAAGAQKDKSRFIRDSFAHRPCDIWKSTTGSGI